MTLHREKGLKAPVPARARTSDYEALIGHRRSTLFDISAISGAAVSPLWYRALQPTLGLLWAEAAGRLSYRATWMYVTDGGHYDNLGLVEALRRGASRIPRPATARPARPRPDGQNQLRFGKEEMA